MRYLFPLIALCILIVGCEEDYPDTPEGRLQRLRAWGSASKSDYYQESVIEDLIVRISELEKRCDTYSR